MVTTVGVPISPEQAERAEQYGRWIDSMGGMRLCKHPEGEYTDPDADGVQWMQPPEDELRTDPRYMSRPKAPQVEPEPVVAAPRGPRRPPVALPADPVVIRRLARNAADRAKRLRERRRRISAGERLPGPWGKV